MRHNTQIPEPEVKSDGLSLDIVDIFYTIQGEGPFAGFPSVFIRLAGCNLRCPLCDTNYTDDRREMSVRDIVETVIARKGKDCSFVVITGGEPLRQNLVPLISALIEDKDMVVQIESNGVYPFPRELEWHLNCGELHYVVSPKTSAIHPRASLATAFKYVLTAGYIDPDDGLPTVALGHTARPRVARPPKEWDGLIYVNPADEKDAAFNSDNQQAATRSALVHGYVLGVQLHKIVGVA